MSWDVWMVNARNKVASTFGVSSDVVELETLPPDVCSGLLLFRGSVVCGVDDSPRGNSFVGVAGPDGVELNEQQVIKKVLRIWGCNGFGVVPVLKVAKTIGFLLSGIESVSAVTSDADFHYLPEDFQPHLHLPRESTNDGRPVIEWWNESGEPPFFRTQLIFEKDGSIQITNTEIWDLV